VAAVLSEVCLDVNDLDRMERFWSAVLGVEPVREDGVSELRLESGLSLLLLPVPEPKAVKDRLHLDLSPRGCDQAEELERLLSLGAVRADVGQGDDVSWHVLADPEGNEFCLLAGRRD
jgi:catechol-2,3-dioxygenase